MLCTAKKLFEIIDIDSLYNSPEGKCTAHIICMTQKLQTAKALSIQ
ncbi:hypothetical protein [Chryseobacterium contaminans]|uniref:Uncharacterized protein n=1 Tax=Chryseobacterium contaminans TaxID=1423959 RepID=A0A1M7CHY1_9FLAO|nr:hypothetical protein [Chryseobacterium contaminans]SHL66783.1 hypothetical protein SAMN05444407_105225 [Chryseobacterium contaminans]